MSSRLSPTYVRVEFSGAIRKAALDRCGGRCEGCNRDLVGVRYVFDHDWPHRLGGASTLENCRVLCSDGPNSCDGKKTAGLDLPGIAARKRHEKGRLALDIDRPVRKPGKIAGRPMPKSSRKIPSRPMRAK